MTQGNFAGSTARPGAQRPGGQTPGQRPEGTPTTASGANQAIVRALGGL